MDGIAGWAMEIMEKLGGPGAGLAIALENLFPPLPSEVILPLAGFTASRGDLSLGGAIFWTTCGSVAGALVLYLLGMLLGADRIRLIADRVPLLKVSDIDRTEAWFYRHGGKAVFLGRMIPIFRSLISIPAGIERMRLVTFLAYTTLGSLIWNCTFVLAGYLLGENWWIVQDYVDVYSKGVLILVVVVMVVFVVTRLVSSRKGRHRLEGDDGEGRQEWDGR
ncbi:MULTISPECIES: DedA family protein [Microtetraspora]|uniref:DedA family protein n=1 Tax=Microtetraspora glauca TaxID=1996 RepID=A0ABV3GM90_MICGL|nr:DedA family protein [Microtetraspora sp. AC03309]MCC5577208.1 DedA family protein [Microtetraspora sp. AC03309]